MRVWAIKEVSSWLVIIKRKHMSLHRCTYLDVGVLGNEFETFLEKAQTVKVI